MKRTMSQHATIARSLFASFFAVVAVGWGSAFGAPVTINPGDTLSVGFRFDSPYTSTPDLLVWGFNTEYTGEHAHKLFNGNTLLGTYTTSSGGSISGFFKSSDSSSPVGTVVDFSSIVNRSINGRMDFSVASGPVQFDPVASFIDRPVGGALVLVADCSSPLGGGCPLAGPFATITSMTLNGGNLIVPEPPPLPPGAPQPGRPDTLIGPTSLVSSNGGGAAIDKTKPTILLTHGWQPCDGLAVSNACPENYTPSDSPLSELLAATRSALTNPDGTQKANILTFQWSAAHTDIATLARVFTDNAGAILAEQLQQALGSDYAQPIHLVGHSFGTMVNARAANLLTDAFFGKAFGVEQVTLLDAPFQDKGVVLMSPSEIYDRLPRGTVQYVDNFYGTSQFAFGGPILGAAPGTILTGGGEAVSSLDHSEIQSVFYKSRVNDLNGRWITSTMGDRYQIRPEPETWSPPPTPFEVVGTLTTEFATGAWRSVVNAGQEVKEYAFEIAGKTYNVVVDAANTVIKKSSEIVVSAFETIGDTATAIIDAGQGFGSAVGNKVMSWIRLRESSPVMIARDVVIPDGAESLRFDLDFLSHGDGDWLTVYFKDQLLWSFRGSDLADDILAASIPLPELAGKQGTLYFTLNSIGDPNADFLIGNLAFTSSATVPEPSTLSLLCFSIGLIWMLWSRQQIANGGRRSRQDFSEIDP